MIHIVQDWNSAQHQSHLTQMFTMRARVFGERLGWDVICAHGQERDSLDDASPVYVISADAADHVTGSCRLLPTTGPTLLESCFSDTIPDAAHLTHPAIWECTRFCVDCDDATCHPGVIGDSTQALVGAIVSLAQQAGIETIVTNLDAITLRVCQKAGFCANVIGKTDRYKSTVYLATFSIEQAAQVCQAERGSRLLRADAA